MNKLLKLFVPLALVGCMTEPTEAPKQVKVVLDLTSTCKTQDHIQIDPSNGWEAYTTFNSVTTPITLSYDSKGLKLPCEAVNIYPNSKLTVIY